MRVTGIFTTCSVVGLALWAGCVQPKANSGGQKAATEAPAQKRLPAEVAGTWHEKDGVWQIVLEPNGAVSSITIPLGEMVVKPHQTTKMQMIDGNFSTFVGGDMTVDYNWATRNLSVYAETAEIHIRVVDHKVDGNRVDRFEGPVSPDGKVWMAQGISILDWGPNDMPQDYNVIEPEPIVFDKVAPAQPQTGDQNKQDKPG